MLTITVGATEAYNEGTKSFIKHNGVELQLEHSLGSLSKWESIHEKPFLGSDHKSENEIHSYIECMLLTKNPPEDFLARLSLKITPR
jgi:hypothetical protein